MPFTPVCFEEVAVGLEMLSILLLVAVVALGLALVTVTNELATLRAAKDRFLKSANALIFHKWRLESELAQLREASTRERERLDAETRELRLQIAWEAVYQ